MYCTKCGSQLAERDVFCSQCGAPGENAKRVTGSIQHRLTRSIYDKKIAGVCGGLAEYLEVDPTLVRLIWVVLTICFPPVLLGYVAAWIVMPKQPPRLLPAVPVEVAQPS